MIADTCWTDEDKVAARIPAPSGFREEAAASGAATHDWKESVAKSTALGSWWPATADE